MAYNFKSEIMTRGEFDAEAFYEAIDGQRLARKLNWKQVAEESEVSASTLTRLSQGKRPDVDSMAALVSWSGLNADEFIRRPGKLKKVEALAQVTAILRGDRNLSREGVIALDALIKTAYEKLRQD
jgi:transcriptional regulator with XRE-family HTH domain